MTTGDNIVAAARGWLGTRFHHQGRFKKTAQHAGGVDCLGLLVGVARELDIQGPTQGGIYMFDETDYSHYPDAAKLKAQLELLLCSIPREGMGCGDVALFKIDGMAQHLGIISQLEGKRHVIHAYAPARCVVEHALDAWWLERIEAVYRI